MREIKQLKEDSFTEIDHFAGISVIRFTAQWCPPCRQTEENFNLAVEGFENILVGKVEVGQAPVLTSRFSIFGLPTVLIFSRGKIIKKIVGPQTLKTYKNEIEKILSESLQDL